MYTSMSAFFADANNRHKDANNRHDIDRLFPLSFSFAISSKDQESNET